jgi:hypothetical protein
MLIKNPDKIKECATDARLHLPIRRKSVMLNFFICRDIIVAPGKFFLDVKNGSHKKLIFCAFFLTAAITLSKSFFSHRENFPYDYFGSEILNQLFSILSIPQVEWALSYFSFFLFLFVLSIFSGMIKENKLKVLFLVSMSISVYGLIFHVLFGFARFVMPGSIRHVAFLVSYFLTIALFCYSLSKAGDITMLKSLILFLLISPLFIITVGLTAVFPFLMWLTI